MSDTKQLSRTTVCALFKIRAPIWNGEAKKRMVGLNRALIRKHNEIHFTYVRKSDGMQSIPGAFYFDGEQLNAVDYEIQNVKGTTLVLIPFSDLQLLERV